MRSGRYAQFFVFGAAAVGLTGCANILGLGDFYNECGGDVDAPNTCKQPSGTGTGGTGGEGGAGGATGGGGSAPACTKAADCGETPHGKASCVHDKCVLTCDAGYGDCDPQKAGCETKLDTLDHCGACGTSCSAFCVEEKCNDPTAVTAAGAATCALLNDGTVWCWGYNQNGEVGVGDQTRRGSPTRVELPSKALEVQMNGGSINQLRTVVHTCAVLDTGALYCWGVLPNRDDPALSPTAISVPLVRSLALGGSDDCIVSGVNELICWGQQNYGLPVPKVIANSVSSATAGDAHACFLKLDKSLWCFGYNGAGQLGTGGESNVETNTPAQVHDGGGLHGDEFISVVARASKTCATTSNGARCWGENSDGLLGTGMMPKVDYPTAIDVPAAKLIALGETDGAAIGDHVYAWGVNSFGQLGDGTVVTRPTPVKIPIPGVRQFALGGFHTCGLLPKGIFCWGANDQGQFGDGSTNSSSHPVAVKWPSTP